LFATLTQSKPTKFNIPGASVTRTWSESQEAVIT